MLHKSHDLMKIYYSSAFLALISGKQKEAMHEIRFQKSVLFPAISYFSDEKGKNNIKERDIF